MITEISERKIDRLCWLIADFREDGIALKEDDETDSLPDAYRHFGRWGSTTTRSAGTFRTETGRPSTPSTGTGATS